MKENSREEDIEILEEMIENANIENMDMNDCLGGEHIEAIQHILSDYKRVLKENEQLRTEVNSLKEKLDEAIKAVDKQEQEEAIEYFKKHIKYFEEQIKFIKATDCDYYDEELELYQNRVKQFNTVLFMLEEKDKIIDLLIKELYTKAHISTRCYLQTSTEECMKYKNCYECLKKHFENKERRNNGKGN